MQTSGLSTCLRSKSRRESGDYYLLLSDCGDFLSQVFPYGVKMETMKFGCGNRGTKMKFYSVTLRGWKLCELVLPMSGESSSTNETL
jgi:hypothetical protein